MARVKIIGRSDASLPIGRREELLAELIWGSILDADRATAAARRDRGYPGKTCRRLPGITWSKSRELWLGERWG
jgi:hypothetical protein